MIGRILAVVKKDLKAFSRDRFYVLVTLLGLVFYVVIFWVLPDSVDETIDLGISGQGIAELFEAAEGADEGMSVSVYDSRDDLVQAIESADGVALGIAFPDSFLEDIRNGSATTVEVLVSGQVPEQLRTAASGMVRELAHAVAGEEPLVSEPAEEELVIGVDRVGEQISLRERFRPLFAFLVLLVEMIALASLVAVELQARTATALLATPLSVAELLAAKGVVGTLLAFVEAMVLLAAMGAVQSLGLVVVVLLGSILVTGFGLLAGSSGRDFIGIVFSSMLMLFPLAIPAVGLLFPGTASAWIRALPSYGLVQAILQATAYGEPFGEYLPHVASLAAWCVVAFGAGWFVLRRRLETI